MPKVGSLVPLNAVALRKKIVGNISAAALVELLHGQQQIALWADAFSESLEAGKPELAAAVCKEKPFGSLTDGSDIQTCLDMLAQYGNADLLRQASGACPRFLTATRIRKMMTEAFIAEKSDIVAYLLGKDNHREVIAEPLIHRALFIPSRLDLDVVGEFAERFDKKPLTDTQRTIREDIRFAIDDRIADPQKYSRLPDKQRAALVMEFNASIVASAEAQTLRIKDAKLKAATLSILCKKISDQRQFNPSGALDKPSMGEMVEEAFERQLPIEGFLALVAQKWGNGQQEFTAGELTRYCADKLGEQQDAPRGFTNWLERKQIGKAGISNRDCMNVFAAATGLEQEQRLMLWRIKHGEFMSSVKIAALQKQMKTPGNDENRRTIFISLYEASGLPWDELVDITRMGLEAVLAHGEAMVGARKGCDQRMQRLCNLLMPQVPDKDMHKQLLWDLHACLRNHSSHRTMTDLIGEALEKKSGKPSDNLRYMIVGGKGFSGINRKTADELGLLLGMKSNHASQHRIGALNTRERQAEVYINLAEKAGIRVTDEERDDALEILTGYKSPSRLLQDVVFGCYDLTTEKRNPDSCLSVNDFVEQQIERRGIHKKSIHVISHQVFDDLKRAGCIGAKAAWKLAEYFEFTPPDARLFVLKAVGHAPITDFDPLLARLKSGKADRKEALDTLFVQTGETATDLVRKFKDHKPGGKVLPVWIAQQWQRNGYVSEPDFCGFLATKLCIPQKAADLKYIFYSPQKGGHNEYEKKTREIVTGRIASHALTLAAEREKTGPREH